MRALLMPKKRVNLQLRLEEDGLLLLFGVLVAVFLIRFGVLKQIFFWTQGILVVDSFLAGLFFTSGFTTPVALAAMVELVEVSSIWQVAFFGALGAVLGDVLIFRFFRDRLEEDVLALLKHKSRMKRLRMIFHLKMFRWLSVFLGGLVFASPLPDELGLMLMGFSKTRTWMFMLVSFVFKFFGILVLGLAVRAL